MITNIKKIEDINTINMYGSGNNEIDKLVRFYVSLKSSKERRIIKFYWYGENKRTVKYHFDMNYSEYKNTINRLIDGVNSLLDKYFDERAETIENASKGHCKVYDLLPHITNNNNKINIY